MHKIKITQEGFIKLTKRSLVVALMAVVVFMGSGYVYLFGPQVNSVDAAWFNDNWLYRKNIPITAHTSAETNVYFSVTLDTSASGRYQGSCQDLRFTDFAGKLLPYFIVSGCGGASTIVHVLVPSFPAGASEYYVYYGNPTVTAGTAAADFATAGTAVSVGTVGAEELASAPVAYWKLDEGNGTSTKDGTQDNNTGTLSSGVTWKTDDMCISSKCASFDGTSNAKITMTDSNSLNISNKLTIGVWVKLNDVTNQQPIMCRWGADPNYQYCLDVFSGNSRILIRNNSGSTAVRSTSTTLVTNTWYYISAVYDGANTTLDIYLNGTLNNGSLSGSVPSTARTVSTGSSTPLIGSKADASTEYVNGFIDEVKVYNTVRSASQIKSDYNARSNNEGLVSDNGQVYKNNPGALNNGLVGYWKEDETSNGASATDSSGVGTTLTDAATVVRAAGKFANGGDFESGSSQYQYAADNATLSITGSLTLSAWVKPESSSDTQNDIIGKWDNSSKESYLLAQRALKVRLYIDSSSNYVETTSNQLTTGTWYHVTGVYNSTSQTAQIYINGAPVAGTTTGTIPSSIGNDTDRFHVGGEQSSGTAANFYDGVVDEARVYNRALSSADITNLYNFGPGPVGYWRLDETSGNVSDTSTNANTGTVTGTTVITSAKYGRGRSFAGGTDIVRITDPAVVDFGTSDFSFSFWVKTTIVGANKAIVMKDNWAGSGSGIYIQTAEDLGNTITYWNGSTSTSFGAMSSTAWVHLAAVRSGTTVSLYYNGALANTVTDSRTFSNASDLTFGGANDAGRNFTGSLDDIKIYNYARTLKQVTEDLNAGHPTGGSPVGSAVGYWKLEQGNGTTVRNSGSAGSTVDGTTANMGFSSGTTGWNLNGKFGRSLGFDGSNDYVTMGDKLDTTFTGSNAQFSLSAWFKPGGTNTNGAIIGKYGGGALNEREIIFRLINDKLEFTWFGDLAGATYRGTLGTKALTSTSTWYHVVAVYDGTNATINNRVSLYVNGVKEATTIDLTAGSPSTIADGPAFLTFGEDVSSTSVLQGQPLNGALDEIKIYNSALNQSEILTDYNHSNQEVLGALGTTSDGVTADNSQTRSLCPPGDTNSSCNSTVEFMFEEGSGTPKESNNTGDTVTFNGTGAHYFKTGKYGVSGLFNGSDDGLVLNNASCSPCQDPGTGSFSISAWVKFIVTNGSSMMIAAKYNSNSVYELAITTSQKATLFVRDSGGVSCQATGTTSLNDGKWHHINGSNLHGSTCFIFVDGKLENSASNSTNNVNTIASTYLRIGCFNTSGITSSACTENLYTGQIDQLRMYGTYSRSRAEVAWEYNKGGPQTWYKFDDCQGTTARDSSGIISPVDGTITIGGSGSQTAAGTCLTSGAWFNGVAGKYNYSLKLDGTDDYVSTASFSPLASSGQNTNTVSWGGWFYPTAANTSTTLMEKTTEFRITTDGSGNYICGIYYSGAFHDATSVTAPLTQNVWNHVMCTMDGGTNIKTYINGVLKNTTADGNVIVAASSALNIGRNSGNSQFFTGQVDDIRIYAFDLNKTMIKSVYNSGAIRYSPTTGAP